MLPQRASPCPSRLRDSCDNSSLSIVFKCSAGWASKPLCAARRPSALLQLPMAPCRIPALHGSPSITNRWRLGMPPLVVPPPLPLRRRRALAARPQAQLGRHDAGAEGDASLDSSSIGSSGSSGRAEATGGAGQAARDPPCTSGSGGLGTSEASSSHEDGRGSTSVGDSSLAEAAQGSQLAALGSSSAAAGSSGAFASSTAASGAADEAAPAEPAADGGAASSSGSSSEGGGFKASMLFQGGRLDWQALRSLQAPKAQPPEQQSQPQAGAAAAALEPPAGLPSAAHIGTLWGLLVLSLAYLHHSTSGFALPALLPIISEDMKLSDTQGALLTAGYTVRGRGPAAVGLEEGWDGPGCFIVRAVLPTACTLLPCTCQVTGFHMLAPYRQPPLSLFTCSAGAVCLGPGACGPAG